MHNQNKKILAKDQELFKTQYVSPQALYTTDHRLRQPTPTPTTHHLQHPTQTRHPPEPPPITALHHAKKQQEALQVTLLTFILSQQSCYRWHWMCSVAWIQQWMLSDPSTLEGIMCRLDGTD
ncbi:hypothetical protein PCANC_05659 [Puccinia coronata f. sp. avenae]|uniref:Uncharacterized protein n=1 Tax=Puccinia coronata f. sp. avenae TaxID=200324 RepID=A0A2N5VY34_9BASI|nr:hypothetical protein PCANC_05659 [Puccinia coronata f. sp. avenae]